MAQRTRIGTEELDSDAINLRFPGVRLTIPCGAPYNDGDTHNTTSVCHVVDDLSRWNYFLWHIGLQLREVRDPGKLDLVPVVYRGKGGCRQRARSLDARILFDVLLVQHRCVNSLHLEDFLIEGSGLGEYRDRVVLALENNTSIESLRIGSLFSDYGSIREELFDSISTMSNIRELVVLSRGPAQFVLLDAICPLLYDTMCLTTLSMPGIVFDEVSAKRFVNALIENDSIEDLSVHGSIVHSYLRNGVSRFSRFLATKALPSSLSVEGVHSDPVSTYDEVKCIIGPLVLRGNLLKLRLAGYLLDAPCAALLAELVCNKEVYLQRLDISGCWWRGKSSPEGGEAGVAFPGAHPGSKEPSCPWLHAFSSSARLHLSFLSLSFAGLQPDDLRPLFIAAVTVESLKTISLRDTSRQSLKQVCAVIRETGVGRHVRLEGTYHVDSSALSELKEFPELLRKVAISSLGCPSPREFGEAVQLAISWFHLTTLNLFLTQHVLSDGPTSASLSKYLNIAGSLRELALMGCNKPNLDSTPRSTGRPHSVLLDATLRNTNIQKLRLSEIRLGHADLRFLVDEIVANKTLGEFSFDSWDANENDQFVQFLAADFRANRFITRLLVSESAAGGGEEWFVIEDVVGRNLGYLACAMNFVVRKNRTPRCAAAYRRLMRADEQGAL
ncbi:hypothetical protein HPB50_024788 [Hyalomma asiaticum]|uniref:Uncharacterized protein n=1 Tax=Hyalomma asiaticum TaxID=266040 RepID=A0ACB7TBH4_HYAAI|nr:hypothetical protein HPB50_024788 [Hyalomma asiaticum]